MSANLAQAIQHYVIRFASLLVAGPWFSLCTLFSSTNKTDPLKKLLKGVLNTKPSSPYVSNRVPLNLFYVFIYCIERWVL